MKLSNSQWLLWEETQALARALGSERMRFVGGAVRDCLLGIDAKDVDVATPLPPQEVMELLTEAGMKVFPTGIDHGTITVVTGKHHFEVTTLRRDVTTDGRRAIVAYTEDWCEDAMRRDFTMNALYCDMEGEISDYFGGVQDAMEGHVRFIGNAAERIREDALRILRFFRFFAWYGKLPADSEALTACQELAEMIDRLSGERIRQEMLKLLVSPNSASVITLMQEHGVLRYVLPAPVSVQALSRLPQLLEKTQQPHNPILALALLLRSAGGDVLQQADWIRTRWKLSNAEQYLLADLCRYERIKPDKDTRRSAATTSSEGVSEAKGATNSPPGNNIKKHIRATGKELFILQQLMTMAEGEDEAQGTHTIALAASWQPPAFPLTGDDLIRRGITPGKNMGALLKRLEEYWEEEEYNPDKQALLRHAGLAE
ncbi:MAG TPA: CCA tRNA nucleotidyltransferase [Rickettsiales bacterium]|nr:CCA tRNA nucleotidyltransferase [Rickettsiales bacterium]